LGKIFIDKYFIVNSGNDSTSQDFDYASINCSEKGNTYEFSIKLRRKTGYRNNKKF